MFQLGQEVGVLCEILRLCESFTSREDARVWIKERTGMLASRASVWAEAEVLPRWRPCSRSLGSAQQNTGWEEILPSEVFTSQSGWRGGD